MVGPLVPRWGISLLGCGLWGQLLGNVSEKRVAEVKVPGSFLGPPGDTRPRTSVP